MFNNDVNQNYNHQDATNEILIMLLGAFLLGYLMCWLLIKLFKNNKSHNSQSTILQTETNNQPLSEAKYVPQTTGDVRIVKNNNVKAYSTPRIDDLTKISGVSDEMQTILKQKGINSFTDLRDIKPESLKSIQDNLIAKDTNKKEIETWPHQASLAAKGDWRWLKEYQAFISRSQKAYLNIDKQFKADVTDDLKIIEGIGPRIEEILKSKGINTFKQLSSTDIDELKKYIVDEDSRFSKNETESWPHQAAMAEKGQWEELNIYQEFMHSETTVDSDNVDSPNNNVDKLNIENALNDHDDLKKMEGIGPKIEEVLNKSGIYTYSQLHNSNFDRLKSILNNAGNQYKIHNPETWQHQAGMAHRNEWQALSDYQKSLQSSNIADSHDNSIKVSNNETIVKNSGDDLKKIEGIGPKIQELLGKAGINTFNDLSREKRDDLKKLLDEGGPQYRVHEPESWPLQARLASNGKWEELQKLQNELIGERK